MDTTKLLEREKTSDKLARAAMNETSDGLGTRLLIWLLRNRLARWVVFVAIVAIAGIIVSQMVYNNGFEDGCAAMRSADRANGYDATAKAPASADSITLNGCTFKLDAKPTP